MLDTSKLLNHSVVCQLELAVAQRYYYAPTPLYCG